MSSGSGSTGVPSEVVWTDDFERVVASDVDVVVELIGGVDPAAGWIRRALEAGKSVVTANKQVIAQCGEGLLDLARDEGRHLLFEAAVAGGIPVVRGLREGLAGDRLVRAEGVLNGTCNYILTRMADAQLSFAAGLAEAQALGYAEADPSADVDGADARAKLAILSLVGLEATDRRRGRSARFHPRESIRSTSCTRDGWAARFDRWRGRSSFRAMGGVLAFVRPALVPLTSMLARIEGKPEHRRGRGRVRRGDLVLGSGSRRRPDGRSGRIGPRGDRERSPGGAPPVGGRVPSAEGVERDFDAPPLRAVSSSSTGPASSRLSRTSSRATASTWTR